MRLLVREEYGHIVLGSGADEMNPGELAQLEAVWRARTGKDPSTFFEYSAKGVRPKNWVGVIEAPGLAIQVTPRGFNGLSAIDKARLDRNLGQMLRLVLSAGAVPLSRADLSTTGSRFERAVESFCDLVLTARRTRVLRRYATHTDVGNRLGGAIVFPQHAFVNLRKPGQFVSRMTELIEDTPENRFLQGVLQFCLYRSTTSMRRRIEGVLSEFEKVGPGGPPHEEYRRIRFERLPAEYVRALSLGRSLLDGAAGGVFSGSLTSRSEVMFMPTLFEGFVARLAQSLAGGFGCQVTVKERGRYLGVWVTGPNTGGTAFEVIPDIELRRLEDARPAVIIDAKWKSIQPMSRGYGVSQDDVYQMVTYAKRFNCDRAILVYPWMGTESPFGQSDITFTVKGGQTGISIGIVCLPLLWDRVSDVVSQLRDAIRASLDPSPVQ